MFTQKPCVKALFNFRVKPIQLSWPIASKMTPLQLCGFSSTASCLGLRKGTGVPTEVDWLIPKRTNT